MIIIDNKKDTFFSDSGSISPWKTQEKTNGWYSMWLTWAKTGPSLRRVWPLWSNPRPDLAGSECLNRTSFTTSHPCTTSTLSSALLSLLTGIVTISILLGALLTSTFSYSDALLSLLFWRNNKDSRAPSGVDFCFSWKSNHHVVLPNSAFHSEWSEPPLVAVQAGQLEALKVTSNWGGYTT